MDCSQPAAYWGTVDFWGGEVEAFLSPEEASQSGVLPWHPAWKESPQ